MRFAPPSRFQNVTVAVVTAAGNSITSDAITLTVAPASGVVISADGYVLTTYRAIDGAEDVKVALGVTPAIDDMVGITDFNGLLVVTAVPLLRLRGHRSLAGAGGRPAAGRRPAAAP